MTWQQERARIAGLTRSRPADHPDLEEARRRMRAELLAEHVQQVLDGTPPLTTEQRQRIANLLTAPGGVA